MKRAPVQEGLAYRNGAGQVRKVLRIDPELEKLTFEVIDPGPDGPGKLSLLVRGYVGIVLIRSFASWAVQEVPVPKRKAGKK